MSISDRARLVGSSDATFREVNGEVVLLHLATSQYHILDETSTDMWKTLLTSASFGEALEAIHRAYDVDFDELRADLAHFVEELAERGLVSVESP